MAVKQSICQSNLQSACACLLSIGMTRGPRLDSLLQGAAHSKDKLIGDYFLPSSREIFVLRLSVVEMLNFLLLFQVIHDLLLANRKFG